MKKLLLDITCQLVDNPGIVKITEETHGNGDWGFCIQASAEDRGRIIGKNGEVVGAVRTVLGHIAMRQGKTKPTLKVLD